MPLKLTTAAAAGAALLAIPVASALAMPTGCSLTPGAACANMDMHGESLVGMKMPGANMRSANLKGMDLRRMNLKGADMRGADLRGANMSGANMDGAKLGGAKMSGAKMNKVSMIRADLTGADLRNARVTKGKWMKANFTKAKIGGMHVYGTDMTGAMFKGTTTRSSGKGMTENGYTENQVGALFSGVNISRAQFDHANIQAAQFVNRTNVRWAESKFSDFTGSTFSDVTYMEDFGIRDSIFDSVHIQGNTWAPAFVSRTSFNNTTCVYANAVPVNRQIIGLSHTGLPSFNGQNASAQGQLTYDGWTIITPTYDFWFVYTVDNGNGVLQLNPVVPVATSAIGIGAAYAPGGCSIGNVNIG